jgi:hypothetical protein
MTSASQPFPLSTDRRRWVWTGYAAFVVGLLSALVSAYWAAGGDTGLDELGGELAELARKRDPMLIGVVWVIAVLKVIGATLGLALVQPWGRRLPRWMLLSASWSATAVMVLWGATQVITMLLLQLNVLPYTGPVDRKPFYWHLFLWDPWFIVWGLLLGAAAWAFVRPNSPRGR